VRKGRKLDERQVTVVPASAERKLVAMSIFAKKRLTDFATCAG